MLSPNSLERATASYRRDYYDGYGGHPHAGASDSLWRPFDGGDYMRGYDAGANDCYCWRQVASV